MNYKMLTTLTLSLMAVATHGQHIGVRAGYNINSSRIDYDDVNVSLRNGFNAGITYDHLIYIPSWSLSSGLLYSQQGFSLRQAYNTDNSSGVSYHFLTHHLVLPILLRKELPIKSFTTFIQAGIYGSYLLGGTVKDGDISRKLTLKTNKEHFDIGHTIAVGGYLTKSIKLLIEYNHSFQKNEIPFGNKMIAIKSCYYTLATIYQF